MKSWRSGAWIAAVASVAVVGAASTAAAQDESFASHLEFSLLGGVQGLSENDTALPDYLVTIPAVATVAYRLSSTWAIEGDFAWLIPVSRSVDVGAGVEEDMKSPDILSYQAGVRANFPSAAWTPYVTAGLGAVTFLENTDADRLPQLEQSQTVFAFSFGGGATYALNERWGLRGDLRELVALPSNDTEGLSSNGESDPIWMGRAAVGLAYAF